MSLCFSYGYALENVPQLFFQQVQQILIAKYFPIWWKFSANFFRLLIVRTGKEHEIPNKIAAFIYKSSNYLMSLLVKEKN